jgi:homoserine O-acetyltransferase/O-succinyltransferase
LADTIQIAPEIKEGQIFYYNHPFLLESGKTLPELKLCYSTYGQLDPNKNNVVWVCHALTGNSNVYEWWNTIFGDDKLFDPAQYFIVCVNVIGSCYGSTEALSINPITQKPYFYEFPKLTMRDIANSFELLRAHLGITKIHTCIGGSLGGQQALEWAVSNPELIQYLILMATNARTSPWGIALNETQRMAIRTDESWSKLDANAGIKGMKVARAIALLSYRSYETYLATQIDHIDELDNQKAISYQLYQGEKFSTRFNAFAYWSMTYLLDSHNVGRNRGSVEAALGLVKAKTLIIGISTDVLFPNLEQEFMHKHIKNSSLHIIESLYGHDGFLMETEKIEAIVQHFYNS